MISLLQIWNATNITRFLVTMFMENVGVPCRHHAHYRPPTKLASTSPGTSLYRDLLSPQTWDLIPQGPTGPGLPLHFRDPQTSADILWLLKHVRLVPAGSMHPAGMLLINIHRAAKQKVMAVTKPRWRPFPLLFLDLCSLKTSSTTSQQTTKLV